MSKNTKPTQRIYTVRFTESTTRTIQLEAGDDYEAVACARNLWVRDPTDPRFLECDRHMHAWEAYRKT